MKTRTKIQAYTLVEILTVVGIIALLSAILFPVISRVRENGRNTTCQSNLKQLGLSLQMYVSDNGGTSPLWWDGPYDPNSRVRNETPPRNGICWTQRLYPYFKNWDLIHCPDASADRDSHDDLDAFDFAGIDTGRPDYDFNANLCGLNEALISAPSNVATFSDRNAFSSYMFQSAGTTPSWAGLGGDRHFNGYNIAFYDGHVKWMSINTMIDGGGTSKLFSGCAPQNKLSYCPY